MIRLTTPSPMPRTMARWCFPLKFWSFSDDNPIFHVARTMGGRRAGGMAEGMGGGRSGRR